jgi:hypothetical protein
MLRITISFAVVKIGLASHLICAIILDSTVAPPEGTTCKLLVYQILSGLETFFTALVATLPALRALIRVKGPQPVALDKSLVCRGDEENNRMIVERYEAQER